MIGVFQRFLCSWLLHVGRWCKCYLFAFPFRIPMLLRTPVFEGGRDLLLNVGPALVGAEENSDGDGANHIHREREPARPAYPRCFPGCFICMSTRLHGHNHSDIERAAELQRRAEHRADGARDVGGRCLVEECDAVQ